MSDVRLRPVTFEDLSAVRHEVWVSAAERFATPEFLVVRYVGAYRDGGAGRGDALYIVATAEAARRAWFTHCAVLDLRELRYAWGDEREWVAGIGWDPVTRVRAPLAIVVGDGCGAGLKSLLGEAYGRVCVEGLEEAFALGRRQRVEYERELKEWRGSA
jgi:hypothetical protein